MIYIQVPDQNDSMATLSIDGIVYMLRFTYNETYDYWSFGLYNEREQPIIAMTRIVPNFPLLHFYTDTDLPNGIFGCVSKKETVGRYDFVNQTAEFIYIPNVELKE